MLINAQRPQELRLAVVTNGTLDEYQVAVATAGLSRGNIYRGIVASTHVGLDAAFVDYGAPKHGLLARHDVVEAARHHKGGDGKRGGRIDAILERGKPILVQVTREPVGAKGAALTANVSLAGRYLVLTPFDDSQGISRKVEDETTRAKLREIVDSLPIPEGCGVIVRTNALDQNKTALNRDLNALLRIWKDIKKQAAGGRGPELLYSDQDLIVQAVRDYLDSSIDEVLVDDDYAFEQASTVMKSFMPRAKTRLTRYAERMPLFSKFGLEDEVERIFKPRVELHTGGSLVIEGTEALTAIDVNSGRSRGAGGEEDNAFRTNMAAAPEVARQLRLRDIGGLIVVDFIDMRSRKHNRDVEKAVRDALKSDRARTTVGRISENGLLEINRQRIRAALTQRTHRECPTCSGTGQIPSPETVSMGLLRRIEERAAIGGIAAVRVALHPELADSLQNRFRQEIAALEREFGIRVEVIAATSLHRSEERVEWVEGQPARADAAAEGGAGEPAARGDEGETTTEGKSRRRRRGGKKARGHGEPAASAGAEEERAAAEDEPAAVPGDGGDEGGAAKPRKRRRGGRRRKKHAADAEPAGEGADGAPPPGVDTGAPEPDTEAPATSGPGEEAGEGGDGAARIRPSRRRRRGGRRHKKRGEGEAAPPADAAAD